MVQKNHTVITERQHVFYICCFIPAIIPGPSVDVWHPRPIHTFDV